MSEDTGFLGWVLIANVSDHIRGGREHGRFYQGTVRFAPGTKVYVGPAYWGMGGQNLQVIGLRRTSRRFVDCHVHIGALTDLRLKGLYSPKLFRELARRPWTELDHLREINREIDGYVIRDEEVARRKLRGLMHTWQSARPTKLKPVLWITPDGGLGVVRYRPGVDRGSG